jgi:hypothetical protein
MATQEQAAQTVRKLGLLAALFSQQGDLILNEDDKAGLVDLLQDISERLDKVAA